MEDFLEGKCGNKNDFWQQPYVVKLVKEAQEAKLSREDAAEQLGVDVKSLKKQISKLSFLLLLSLKFFPSRIKHISLS